MNTTTTKKRKTRKKYTRQIINTVAATITVPKKIEVKKVKLTPPASEEVLIRMEGSGICASNIPVWEGREWFDYPMEAGAPGHEGWGIVEETGKDVKNIKPGDRVAALSYNAYANYDKAKANAVIKLPEGLNDLPFPGEPLGCAMNIYRRSNILEGQTVAIIGIGFLGAMLIQLAKHAGAKVIAISRRPTSLAFAGKFGADEIMYLEGHQKIIEKVKMMNGSNLCERVIEATGKQNALDLAGKITGERGKLIVAGFHQDGMRKVDMQLWNWRGIDVINAHERDREVYIRGMKEAVKAIEKKILNPFDLITHTFSLNEANEAFEHLVERPEGFMKGIFKYEDHE